MKKIKLKDEVIIIAGKDKGSIGTVIEILNNKNKIIVEGKNIAKKHIKPNPNMGITGGIEDKEMPLAISNVAIYNAATKKADKVGIRFVTSDAKKNKKERFFKSNGEAIV